MSTRAKITLAGSFAFCGLTIWGLMRAGLVREEERQQRKQQQRANKEELDAQKALHEHLIRSQSVKSTSGTASDSE
ncbi:hypothetical protein INT44_003931 [Umbelopsis vinacea]|uniref:Uncharacterized protein n=1 Tax=Umbelopsis vinacea TaxID=44442 RepID=A0A8H7QA21_9FUNG|nr:hypothetical protein INT44_003931 [Umbelopsis vinacea]